MAIPLPPPVERYLRADAAHDEPALAACFTDDAEVRDEGRTIRGPAAITAWKRESQGRYQYVVEPLACTQVGDSARLTARVSGNFPGSPAELTYVFGLRGDRIASLEIG